MAIDSGIVERVAAAVALADARLPDIDLQNALRHDFAGLRVVVCNDDDVPPRIAPVLGNAQCNLYFLDAGEHCVKLTSEAAAASGLVVGRIEPDAH